jgi:hypothetical protein
MSERDLRIKTVKKLAAVAVQRLNLAADILEEGGEQTGAASYRTHAAGIKKLAESTK